MKNIIYSYILGFLLLPVIAHAEEDKPLNFINIIVDDMGYSDIGCMGGPVETPNLDKLAASGILFTNYRTYPKCMPTRDAIMTGMDAPPVRIKKDGITLAEALKVAGYSTYFVGKAHGTVIGSMEGAVKRGFDRSFGNSGGGISGTLQQDRPVLMGNHGARISRFTKQMSTPTLL